MTQGLLTITLEGRVVLKAVCGCDGENVHSLAEEIKRNGFAPSARQMESMAEEHGFGCKNCRVILTGFKRGVQIHTKSEPPDVDGDPWKLYRSSFANPNFTPRWERGDGAITEIVVLPVAK